MGRLCRGGGRSGSGVGVAKGGGEFNGHGGEEGFIKGRLQGASNEKDEGGEASSYTPGGVLWHGKTRIQVAKSLLRWNILSNGPSTADGSEFLCVSRFSQFHSVPHFLGVQGAEMGSSSHRLGFRDRAIGGKHGTCHECSRTVEGGVCM